MPPALVDKQVFKKNSQELEAREESWNKLQTTKILKVPKYLTDEAKKEWRRVMKLYNQMEADILSDLDQQALIMYCEATAIYKKAQEQWAKLNQVATPNPDGQRLIDNILKTMERQSKIISSLSEQLCLTPVGRARMGMNATKIEEDDPLLAILNKKNEAS
jgi:P27 family predicted phage terminase small subunit